MKPKYIYVLASLLAVVALSLWGCGGGNDEDPGPAWKDKTYNLEIDLEKWTEPTGIGDIIGSYVPTFLLGVTEAGDTTIGLIGALVPEDCEDEQDMCQETITFPGGSIDENRSFTVGPADFPILIGGFPVKIHDLYITGTIYPDGSYFDGGSFTGVLDAREFTDYFGTDEEGVCELVASVGANCEICPYDGEEYCLMVKAEKLNALEVPGLAIVEINAGNIDPGCNDDGSQCELNDKLVEFQSGVFNGYTLYSPNESETTYLIDICGEAVYTWQSDYTPGHAYYLLENGHLLRAGNARNQKFTGGGTGGIVEEFDWDGNLLWKYEYSSSEYCQHHDIEMLPNGNVLLIAWELKTYEEVIAAGRDPDKLRFNEMWPDHVVEVEPAYPTGGKIVWEWHTWDHLIQDYDPQKDNYGVVADHPELLDINFAGVAESADWNHTNSIAYNADLDQILLSFHTTSEIVVIDHSTTTEEAASHKGGRSGKGGNILYRWGNPQAYRAGGPEDQQFFGQHNAHWIGEGMSGEGNIMVFNNGMGRPDHQMYSSVDEIVPPEVDADGNYSLTPGSTYGPVKPIWTYTAPNKTDFFSPAISGAQRLPNGNTLVCSGKNGVFFEVTDQGDTLWEYKSSAGTVFRAYRYAPDYAGLGGL